MRFTRRYASPRLISKKMHDIGPEEEAGVAMKKMTELGIRRLPVIEKGRLMGEDSNKTAFDLISKIYIP